MAANLRQADSFQTVQQMPGSRREDGKMMDHQPLVVELLASALNDALDDYYAAWPNAPDWWVDECRTKARALLDQIAPLIREPLRAQLAERDAALSTIRTLSNELSWDKKTRTISDRISSALTEPLQTGYACIVPLELAIFTHTKRTNK